MTSVEVNPRESVPCGRIQESEAEAVQESGIARVGYGTTRRSAAGWTHLQVSCLRTPDSRIGRTVVS